MGYHTSAARATCVGCGGNLEIRAEFCRCTGARFWRSCHQSRVNERSESNRRHQASLSTFEVQGAAGRAVAIARCSVRRHRASCSSLDLSKTSSASVARTGPKKSHSEIISLSALPSEIISLNGPPPPAPYTGSPLSVLSGMGGRTRSVVGKRPVFAKSR